MMINKIGFEHREYGLNCQDYGFEAETCKCVLDGCSEGKHSEVGAKLFGSLLENSKSSTDIQLVTDIFEKMTELLGHSTQACRDFLCFTILFLTESPDSYNVYVCGDGYIIKQYHNDDIEFCKIDDGEFPRYYAYNFIDKIFLSHYKKGVQFTEYTFPKKDYKNIGLATDGLRYIFGNPFEPEFIRLLKHQKTSALKRLINREISYFKDDITIVF